ncbi:MAG: hypothetical protein LBL42_03195 [Tannerella sp.]|nr:hypothetical protein [Tannerella sp.]
MKKFTALSFRFVPNAAHYQFFDRATTEVSNAGSAVQTALGPLVAEVNADCIATCADAQR